MAASGHVENIRNVVTCKHSTRWVKNDILFDKPNWLNNESDVLAKYEIVSLLVALLKVPYIVQLLQVLPTLNEILNTIRLKRGHSKKYETISTGKNSRWLLVAKI
jgi:hypothetical protein